MKMTDINRRIVEDKITIESHTRSAPYWAGRGEMNWYDVVLRMGRSTFRTPFGMGKAHERFPDVYDVLSCVLSDAAGIESTHGFRDWCTDYGIEPTKDEREKYDLVVEQTESLKRFLGKRKYNDYVFNTEDDG